MNAKELLGVIARMTKSGETVDGDEFVMEADDAISVVNRLIDEARAIVAREGEADVVPVAYWDAYGGEEEVYRDFSMEIFDGRQSGGQSRVTVLGDEENVLLDSLVEINVLPGSREPVPCLHLFFDGDSCAASFFKQEGCFIVRPEKGVTIRPTVLPNGESAWILAE